jgi:GT2 family glycosyltransferase
MRMSTGGSDPYVSVVMVVFGRGWDWVPGALAALARNTCEPYEVILIDNGGVEERPSLAGHAVQLVRNERNVGFGPASNQGVERGRADVVCFLNPDVVVEPGWLNPLLERLLNPSVGAVFPAKLNMDGSIQDTGAFVTREGLAYLFGYGRDADSVEYGFARDVDYGSAACMCMLRERFLSAGGFDAAYRVAYYEDTDLCFRIRKSGLRLVYEPRSRVVHALTVSTPSSELQSVLAVNREIFVARWRSELERRPRFESLQDPRVEVLARDLHASERVLLVDGTQSSTLRIAASWATRRPRARVTLLTERIDPERQSELLRAGVEVISTDTPYDWLLGRRGHYSHLIKTDDTAWLRLGSLARKTQPQALIIEAAPVAFGERGARS